MEILIRAAGYVGYVFIMAQIIGVVVIQYPALITINAQFPLGIKHIVRAFAGITGIGRTGAFLFLVARIVVIANTQAIVWGNARIFRSESTAHRIAHLRNFAFVVVNIRFSQKGSRTG